MWYVGFPGTYRVTYHVTYHLTYCVACGVTCRVTHHASFLFLTSNPSSRLYVDWCLSGPALDAANRRCHRAYRHYKIRHCVVRWWPWNIPCQYTVCGMLVALEHTVPVHCVWYVGSPGTYRASALCVVRWWSWNIPCQYTVCGTLVALEHTVPVHFVWYIGGPGTYRASTLCVVHWWPWNIPCKYTVCGTLVTLFLQSLCVFFLCLLPLLTSIFEPLVNIFPHAVLFYVIHSLLITIVSA